MNAPLSHLGSWDKKHGLIGYRIMSAAKKFDPQEVLSERLADARDPAGQNAIADRLAAVEDSLLDMRREFLSLRKHYMERERKGTMLVDAYKQVLADMTDLFEAQREENIKREESLRFFLSSIEARLASDLRADLGLEAVRSRRGIWPFRRSE
jgi:hypothetical protein